MGCNNDRCGGCSKCETCGGCGGGSLTLTPQEVQVLELLRTYAFLPVARRADTMEPHCFEPGMPEGGSLALELLEKKSLVELDYSKPMGNFDYGQYKGFPVKGSVGLTLRGQQVLELLEIQGIAETVDS